MSIRTHLLKDIEIIKSYNSKHYSGPAIKAGSGVQVSELYAAAHEAGLMAVGGEGITVGWGGGYIAGGGHSPLSSIHGLASDQALSFSIVLPNGRLVTADPSTNPDLFWALRGGGGSTFGVVVSITVKAFPDIPITTSIFSFDSSPADLAAIAAGDLSNSNFWSLVKFYLTLFPAHADAGIYSYWFILPVAATPGAQKFLMQPFFAPNKTVADVTALLQPLIAAAAALSIQIDPTTTQYPGFHPAWANGFPKEAMGGWNAHIGSRLFPRTNWNSPEKLDAQFTALRGTGVTFLIGFNIAPTLRAGNVSANETAANPAWRSALMHVIVGTDVGINERDPEVVRKTVLQFTDGPMRKWKEASVGSGAYLGESDTMDPDWQQAFYGSSYPRLYRIKQEYDPRGVFFAETAVGSEDWSTGPYRTARLCPV